jgi:5-methylcytosine-specific restriction endonuclease McrA
MMTSEGLRYETQTKTVIDLINLHEDGLLNLEPGFQRQSVWSERDRAKLIDSILRGYPLPAIFLYKRQADGRMVSDVVDGKQRLESVLMFAGEMRGKFRVHTQLPGHEERTWYDWSKLGRAKLHHLVENYKLTCIEIDGGLSDIIDVFVRINSTGKALTGQERRHARYYKNSFLKEADRLARRLEPFWRRWRIFSQGQLSRMRHIELIAELMLSIHKDEVLNKKAALDQVMSADGLAPRDVAKASKRTFTAVNRIRHMFPKLYATRFVKVSDFYSLALLVAKFEAEGLVLADRRRNRLAADILRAFSTEVDTLVLKTKKVEALKPGQEVYRQYLLTVREGTDRAEQRRAREQILRRLLETLFARKNTQRLFTAEQRRVVWNSSSARKCERCRCALSWQDFTVDHIDPHSKGGRSRLENAALMCRSCNSSKGNRRS